MTEWDRAPFVPVTPTWTIETAVNVHDSVALPEPATLVGATEQDVLLVVRLTIPAKPLSPVTVMFEVPAEFTLTLTPVGLTAMVKSWTTNVTVTEWDSDPLVLVTPTCTVEAEEKVHDSVELPEPLTLVGERVHDVLFVVRETDPANPFSPVTVIADVPAAPALTVTLEGLAVVVKSWTMNVALAEWDRLPLVPVMVRV